MAATEKETRDTVTWHSTAFNTAIPQPYFINPECYGDDAARWLISRLRAAGIDTDSEPDQEDFGWFFEFRVEQQEYWFILTYRADEDGKGVWIGSIEPAGRLLARILMRRPRVQPLVAEVIHRALSSAPEIHDLRWHRKHEFDKGIERGSPTPTSNHGDGGAVR